MLQAAEVETNKSVADVFSFFVTFTRRIKSLFRPVIRARFRFLIMMGNGDYGQSYISTFRAKIASTRKRIVSDNIKTIY
jgi:hypothetical protein